MSNSPIQPEGVIFVEHNPRLRVLSIFSVAFATVAALVWLINEQRGLWRRAAASPPAAVETRIAVLPSPIETMPQGVPSPDAAPPPSATPDTATQIAPLALAAPDAMPEVETGAALSIPVAGVSFDKLQNTFKDARSGGRVHDAIDIMAPGGTPVIACTDGRIAKLFNSERGGITLYQLSMDERTVYYYAHLASYAPGIAEGNTLRRGDLVGYVGDTGNAGAGNFHLHFAVSQIDDPRDIHGGIQLNPYDLFRPR